MMESNIRRRRRHDTPVETVQRRTALPSQQQELHKITHYANKALVPYQRDNDSPSFGGAQGVVYKANVSSGVYGTRAFAIKEIHLSGDKERKRLENEILHLRKCDHPNVLKLHEAFTIEGDKWTNIYSLVTEPWAEASFERFFADLGSSQTGMSASYPWHDPARLFPWPSIVKQCLLGLQHLHTKSIKHKDLKPANILLLDESSGKGEDQRVRVIIADLGISKASTIGAPTSFDGTQLYMAPEQHAKESSTTKSDIFSLGACFALIQAVLCTRAGKKVWMRAKQNQEGFFAIDKIAEGGFAANIDQILALLAQMLQDTEAQSDPAGSLFRSMLQRMVQKMFTVDPIGRPTANELCQMIEGYEWESWREKANKDLVQEIPQTFPRWNIRLDKSFNAESLQRIAGIKIRWTDVLADHLLLNEDNNTLHLFRATPLLQARKDISDAQDETFDPEPGSLADPAFVDETIRTLALLFPNYTLSETRVNAQTRTENSRDLILSNYTRTSEARVDAQTGNRNGRDLILGSQPVRRWSLSAEERQLDSFKHWHDRLAVLKQVYDESRPANIRQLWYDRRQTHQWYTFWAVVLFGGLSIVLSAVQVVLGAMQLQSVHRELGRDN